MKIGMVCAKRKLFQKLLLNVYNWTNFQPNYFSNEWYNTQYLFVTTSNLKPHGKQMQ